MTFNKYNIFIKQGEIPGLVYGDIQKTKNIFVHLNISNGTKDICKFFSIPEFKNSCYYIFDLPGHGECYIRAKRSVKWFIKIIRSIISKIKMDNKNLEKFYIVGESFGANLGILLAKKYPAIVNKVIAINPPLKLKNPKKSQDEVNADNTFKLAIKYIVTLLTNINTHSIPKGINQLTDNQIFIRVWKMYSSTKMQDTKVNLAAWFSMAKARKALINHFNKNLQPPILLIDTKKEFYYSKNKKTIEKIIPKESALNKVLLLNNGYHILTIDIKYSNVLWKELLLLDK
ncbi:MAG: alpha/beta hydrolase [Mycoplasmoidaceae bacterium]|nr:alpha/beta hydrolase [Mycoplasmoidaceae bacterium]